MGWSSQKDLCVSGSVNHSTFLQFNTKINPILLTRGVGHGEILKNTLKLNSSKKEQGFYQPNFTVSSNKLMWIKYYEIIFQRNSAQNKVKYFKICY